MFDMHLFFYKFYNFNNYDVRNKGTIMKIQKIRSLEEFTKKNIMKFTRNRRKLHSYTS